MHQRKTRIVNFRVTEEEYELLRSASLTQGLSAYARKASLTLAHDRSREQAPDSAQSEFVIDCLSELRRRVAELEMRLDVLNNGPERLRQSCA
jgi:hypothetical protein